MTSAIGSLFTRLFQAQSKELGVIATLNSLVAGTLYTAGAYTNVPLTGGSGTGATANITVDVSGHVTVVTIVSGGIGYAVADVLSAAAANIGGTGSGFTVNVATVVSTAVNDFVSEPFRLDDKGSAFGFTQLRTYGDLDGGTAVLQSCNPELNPTVPATADNYADPAIDSTDWKDTDDDVEEQALSPLNFSKLWFRMKLTDLGKLASFNAEIIRNA